MLKWLQGITWFKDFEPMTITIVTIIIIIIIFIIIFNYYNLK